VIAANRSVMAMPNQVSRCMRNPPAGNAHLTKKNIGMNTTAADPSIS